MGVVSTPKMLGWGPKKRSSLVFVTGSSGLERAVPRHCGDSRASGDSCESCDSCDPWAQWSFQRYQWHQWHQCTRCKPWDEESTKTRDEETFRNHWLLGDALANLFFCFAFPGVGLTYQLHHLTGGSDFITCKSRWHEKIAVRECQKTPLTWLANLAPRLPT